MSVISLRIARFGCFGVSSHLDQLDHLGFSTCMEIVVFQFIVQEISVRNTTHGEITFPRIHRRVELF